MIGKIYAAVLSGPGVSPFRLKQMAGVFSVIVLTLLLRPSQPRGPEVPSEPRTVPSLKEPLTHNGIRAVCGERLNPPHSILFRLLNVPVRYDWNLTHTGVPRRRSALDPDRLGGRLTA